MARPASQQPTPVELEVMKILWERGQSTVREVFDELVSKGDRRAYTSVMSLMHVMTEKKFLRRRTQGRAYLYESRLAREATLGRMVGDLWERAFEGSAATFVTRLLQETCPKPAELKAIREAIEQFEARQDGTRS